MWLVLYCAMGSGCTWPTDHVTFAFSSECMEFDAPPVCLNLARELLAAMPRADVPVIDDFSLGTTSAPIDPTKVTVTVGRRIPANRR